MSIRCVAQPLLDGYREDWDVAAEPTPLPTTTGYGARAAGRLDRAIPLSVSSKLTIRISTPSP